MVSQAGEHLLGCDVALAAAILEPLGLFGPAPAVHVLRGGRGQQTSAEKQSRHESSDQSSTTIFPS